MAYGYMNALIKYGLLSILLIVGLIQPERSEVVNYSLLSLYLAISIFSIMSVFYCNRTNKNLCRIDVFFIVGFCIVHFQWPLMKVLGVELEELTQYWVDSERMNYGTWLSCLGIVSWSFFYISAKDFFEIRNYKNPNVNNVIDNYIDFKLLAIVSYIFFALFIVTAGSSFLSGGAYKGDDGGPAAEGIGAYVQLLLNISLLIYSVVVMIKLKQENQKIEIKKIFNLNKPFFILATSYILLFISVGDRGTAIQLIIALGVLIGSFIYPIKFKLFASMLVFFAIVMSVIGLGRGEEGMADGYSAYQATKSESPFLASFFLPTLQLSNSARTLYSAISNVPEQHDYFQGRLMLGNILGTVPLARKTYLEFFDTPSYEMSSSAYITYLKRGINPKSGEGTSLIADIYLNFGYLGVVLIMGVLGLFFSRLDHELVTKRNLYLLVIATIVASLSLYIGRANVLVFVKSIFWAILFVFVFFGCHFKGRL